MAMTGIRLQSVAYSPAAPVSTRANPRKRATIDLSVGGRGIATTGQLLQDWGNSMDKIGDALLKADGMAAISSGSALKSLTSPSTAGTAAQGASSAASQGNWSGFATLFSNIFKSAGK